MFLDFTHFSSDDKTVVSNGDIVVSPLLLLSFTIFLKQSQSAWKEVEHFELDKILLTHDRIEVCSVLSAEFPALAVSIHCGTHLIENQFAKELGGFVFRVT
jgi:hypothetical protein